MLDYYSILNTSWRFFFTSKRIIETPFLPALPVLPDLWIKGSVFLGGSSWITNPTFYISNPLEATSVAIKILVLPSLKAFKLYYLSFWDISPCKKDASRPRPIAI